MPAATSEPRRKRYEVKNWRRYNEALVSRGDITFWFSEEVVDAWEHENEAKKNGRPFVYSDLAIETLLTIRELFRLPYRQTKGFGRALAKLMDAGVAIPDYTSLQKRAAKQGQRKLRISIFVSVVVKTFVRIKNMADLHALTAQAKQPQLSAAA